MQEKRKSHDRNDHKSRNRNPTATIFSSLENLARGGRNDRESLRLRWDSARAS